MNIPQWFAEALESQFLGRLRVRWSPQAHQFLIEQKIGRRKLPKRRVSELDDHGIRLRDGYEFVLGVTPGSRAQCPHCGNDSKVPVMQMKFATCDSCGKEFRACHWPLGDGLLEWLRFTDPYRDGLERMLKDVEAQDLNRDLKAARAKKNEREDILRDNFTKLFQIQSVGYTGKVFSPTL